VLLRYTLSSKPAAEPASTCISTVSPPHAAVDLWSLAIITALQITNPSSFVDALCHLTLQRARLSSSILSPLSATHPTGPSFRPLCSYRWNICAAALNAYLHAALPLKYILCKTACSLHYSMRLRISRLIYVCITQLMHAISFAIYRKPSIIYPNMPLDTVSTGTMSWRYVSVFTRTPSTITTSEISVETRYLQI
jgi:hypothetical protein